MKTPAPRKPTARPSLLRAATVRGWLGAPTLVVAEVRHGQLRRGEGAVGLHPGHPNPVGTEPDDVGPAVTGGIGQQSQVALDPRTVANWANSPDR